MTSIRPRAPARPWRPMTRDCADTCSAFTTPWRSAWRSPVSSRSALRRPRRSPARASTPPSSGLRCWHHWRSSFFISLRIERLSFASARTAFFAFAAVHDEEGIGPDRDDDRLAGVEIGGHPLAREMFAFRADDDVAQLATLRAGLGIGACQRCIAERDRPKRWTSVAAESPARRVRALRPSAAGPKGSNAPRPQPDAIAVHQGARPTRVARLRRRRNRQIYAGSSARDQLAS